MNIVHFAGESLHPPAPPSTASFRHRSPRPLQSLTMIAVRPNVLRKVCTRHNLNKLWYAIPLCLCFFKQDARLYETFSARMQSLLTKASSGFAFPAGMEHLIVRSQASSAGYVLGFLLQPIDSSPCGHRLLLIEAIVFVMERRTFAAQHTTRRHHPGHGFPRIESLAILDRPTLSIPDHGRCDCDHQSPQIRCQQGGWWLVALQRLLGSEIRGEQRFRKKRDRSSLLCHPEQFFSSHLE